jgi:hypothetical protein
LSPLTEIAGGSYPRLYQGTEGAAIVFYLVDAPHTIPLMCHPERPDYWDEADFANELDLVNGWTKSGTKTRGAMIVTNLTALALLRFLKCVQRNLLAAVKASPALASMDCPFRWN